MEASVDDEIAMEIFCFAFDTPHSIEQIFILLLYEGNYICMCLGRNKRRREEKVDEEKETARRRKQNHRHLVSLPSFRRLERVDDCKWMRGWRTTGSFGKFQSESSVMMVIDQ